MKKLLSSGVVMVQEGEGETYELDEWLSEFIDLFALVTNIDPFK
jgi:hypothetical protein